MWNTLYVRQSRLLTGRASVVHGEGLVRLGISAQAAPKLHDLNQRLAAHSRWQVVPAPGIVPDPEFFGMLARRRFPLITRLRPPEELNYAKEPDLWHDAFGHLPFLTHHAVACLYERFGLAAQKALARSAPLLLERIKSLYWYTIEFGLLREAGRPVLFGAGILPSPDETRHVLSGGVRLRPFCAKQVADEGYTSGRLQTQLFVISSLEELARDFDAWARSEGL